jgi:hypothetical protein
VAEPGIDEHEWTSRYAAIDEDLRTAPAESLSELDELVAEMMEARGVPLEEREGEEATEPETIRQFVEARRVTRQIDDGESFDPGDVANAVDAYRSLYDYLLHVGPTPGTSA